MAMIGDEDKESITKYGSFTNPIKEIFTILIILWIDLVLLKTKIRFITLYTI